MDWYVGKEWSDVARGLQKKVLSLEFQRVEKPLLVSTVAFTVKKPCANLGSRPSKYLVSKEPQQYTLDMGSADSPIDCYIEILLQQFVIGETSACSITTKTGECLEFELKLDRIVSNKQIDKLSAGEMYNLALKYKENGVAMYKAYPKFACDYFSRAAKLLITYKPFDKLDKQKNGIAGNEMEQLFVQIQTNLAACMILEKRYEHVIYHTEFVDTQEQPSEKSIYRRALAFYYLKEFEKAQNLIERVPQYEDKREFTKLRDNIATSWKSSNANYKQLVQRMFT
ncbi:PREDICTED: peptidyl-prolyl cis-trans isomerase CPR6 [Drosophila arizonae]|uniref:Peptidyl-prolyl cis-trans isomerase CPR6 n=1 Tax=Drosophila arizonae TaxID=7263 RepID=A0ABM1NMD8_DROAR|nr:PREDICTED: peptidyl-prolyl cis-trans isomerase CPR6 [Drosophila arizonae]